MNKYIILGGILIVAFLILRFFVCKFFYKCKLLNDILQEQGVYSQGRMYLLLSIICYYITLGIMTGKGLKPNIGIDIKTLEIIIGALQWNIALMAGYVFGSKGLEVLKTIMDMKTSRTNTTNNNQPQ